MKKDIFGCDVWIEGKMQSDCLTIKQGKDLMKSLKKKKPTENIYMYSYRSKDGKSDYYFFKGNRILKETNNLDN